LIDYNGTVLTVKGDCMVINYSWGESGLVVLM